MNDRVTAGVGIGITGKQVEKPAFRKEFLPVKVQRKARVKEHIVPYHALDKLRYEAVMPENRIVGDEVYSGSVTLRGFLFRFIAYQFAFFKFGYLGSPVPVRLHNKRVRQRVNRLASHAV